MSVYHRCVSYCERLHCCLPTSQLWYVTSFYHYFPSLYASIDDCIPQMCQLLRASTLLPADQSAMVYCYILLLFLQSLCQSWWLYTTDVSVTASVNAVACRPVSYGILIRDIIILYKFKLDYASIDDCIPQTSQLWYMYTLLSYNMLTLHVVHVYYNPCLIHLKSLVLLMISWTVCLFKCCLHIIELAQVKSWLVCWMWFNVTFSDISAI